MVSLAYLKLFSAAIYSEMAVVKLVVAVYKSS